MLDLLPWSSSQHSMISEMDVADISISTTGSLLLKLTYINRYRNNTQHSMLANSDYNNISIDKYK